MSNIYKATEENIRRAAEIIKRGGLVAFPTETVYGLGANALNSEAAAKIFEAKRRPFFDPLISHISEVGDIWRIAQTPLPPLAKELAQAFWPGPLTLVLPKADDLPDIITSGLATAAVRMPAHPVAARLLKVAGVPIAAPSANTFGSISPTTAEHVYEDLGAAAEMILDGGPCSVGVESTIVAVADNHLTLLRPGGITSEELAAFGKLAHAPAGDAVTSPGMLPYHYAPKKPVYIVAAAGDMPLNDEDAAFLFFRKADYHQANINEERAAVLSEDGDLREAAANVFACLHKLDKSSAKRIFAEAVPQKDLGLAIMDRLSRAAKKTEM